MSIHRCLLYPAYYTQAYPRTIHMCLLCPADYAQVPSIPWVLCSGAFYTSTLRTVHRRLLYPAYYRQVPSMPRVIYTGAFYTLHTIHRSLLYPAYYIHRCLLYHNPAYYQGCDCSGFFSEIPVLYCEKCHICESCKSVEENLGAIGGAWLVVEHLRLTWLMQW